MGKKLDALLGRTFKSSKFKPVVNLAISRLAVLKNQRQVRCNQARSDVVQLLQQGHHDRALLRVRFSHDGTFVITCFFNLVVFLTGCCATG